MFPIRHILRGRSSSPSKGLEAASDPQQNYALTRMDIGVNKSEVVSGKIGHGAGLHEDWRSDTVLMSNAAVPDAIQTSRDFRVD